MDWRKGSRTQTKPQQKPMKYTAAVHRIREITVEAETQERATTLLKRRLEKGETITSIQTNLL